MEGQKITVEQLDGLCLDLFDKREQKNKLQEQLKAVQADLDSLESKIIAVMDETEKEKIHVKGKGLIYTTDRFTVPTPKNLDDKKKFFKHLTERGIFFEMVSVNSQTLNTFYKSEMENAVARGDVDFKLPGIGEPSHVRTLSVRKG